MIIFARPLAVYGCVFPFRELPAKAKLYVSWVGLRGAVPIIFATYLLAADIVNARIMFNVVFFITILSLLVQGTLVPFVARFLGLAEDADLFEKPLPTSFDMDSSEEIKSVMSKVVVRKESLKQGNCLLNMPVPENTLVVMVRRGQQYFVPKGNTEIEPQDVLFVISDDDEGLRETFEKLGIKHYHLKKH